MLIVLLDAGTSGNTRIPNDFTFEVSGEPGAHGFYLIGVGPLGLIIELFFDRIG